MLRSTLAASLALAAWPAAAHIQLVSPQARSGTGAAYDYVNQKAGPCGLAGRSANVTTLPAGATITVLFDEIIDHPGEFRIAFDADGDDDLAPPVWSGDPYGSVGAWVTPPGVTLLADHVPDLVGTFRGAVEVTLPDVACTNCTLQLIQVMTDKPPFIGDNDFYFMCADLVLEAPAGCGDGIVQAGEGCDDGNAEPGDGCSAACEVEPPPPSAGGGCGAPGGAGALALLLAALPLAARRRAPRRRP